MDLHPPAPELTAFQIVAHDDFVLEVVIDHPTSALNAVDDRLHRELALLFGWLRRVDGPRAVLLRAADGKKAFSAGGDFTWFPTLREIGALEHLRRDAKALIWDLLDVEIPIICALNGPAIGLGASIALLCDALVMADTASVADPHVRVGIVAGDGGTVIWPLALGPMLAKRYLLTGDPVDAAEAHRLGLASHVVAGADVRDTALALARRLAAGAPLAIRYTKAAVNQQVKQALSLSFDLAMGHELVTFLSADHAEALTAISERRPPTFHGR